MEIIPLAGQRTTVARWAPLCGILGLVLLLSGCSRNGPTRVVTPTAFAAYGYLLPPARNGLVAVWRVSPDSSVHVYGSRPDTLSLTTSQFALVVGGTPRLEWRVDGQGKLSGFSTASGLIGVVSRPAVGVTRVVLSHARSDTVVAIETSPSGKATSMLRSASGGGAPNPGAVAPSRSSVARERALLAGAPSETQHLISIRCGGTLYPVSISGVYSFPGSKEVHPLLMTTSGGGELSSTYWMQIPLEAAAAAAIVRHVTCEKNRLAPLAAACSLPELLRDAGVSAELQRLVGFGGLIGAAVNEILGLYASVAIDGLCSLQCHEWYEVDEEQLETPPASASAVLKLRGAGFETQRRVEVPLFAGSQSFVIDVSTESAGPHIVCRYELVSRNGSVQAKVTGTVPCAPAGAELWLEVSRRFASLSAPDSRTIGPIALGAEGQFIAYSGALEACQEYDIGIVAKDGGREMDRIATVVPVSDRGAQGSRYQIDVRPGWDGDWTVFGTCTYFKNLQEISVPSTFGVRCAPVYSGDAEGVAYVLTGGWERVSGAVFGCCGAGAACVTFAASSTQHVRYYDSEVGRMKECTIRGVGTYAATLGVEGDRVVVTFAADAEDANAQRAQEGPFQVSMPHGFIAYHFGY